MVMVLASLFNILPLLHLIISSHLLTPKTTVNSLRAETGFYSFWSLPQHSGAHKGTQFIVGEVQKLTIWFEAT